MEESNPTARALLALELIQAAPGTTAQRLAERLGVSDRAARRYVAVLRAAGVPIESTRGPYGGYRLGRGLRVPPLMFTPAETLGLVMAVLDGHHDAHDPDDPVGGALGKLLRVLPTPVAQQADDVRRTAATAPDRGAARPDPTTATELVRACADQRRVLLGYRTESGSDLSVEVDPWAVVVRHGRWYLLCWSHTAEGRRAYRVDRVTTVDVLPATFTPPDGLDPVVELEDHLAVGWEYDAEVVLDAPLADLVGRLPRALGRLEAIDDRTTRLIGSTSNPSWYADQLTTAPVAFRVLAGAEIRHTVQVLGERLLAATR